MKLYVYVLEYLPIYPDSNCCLLCRSSWKVLLCVNLFERGHFHRLRGHRRTTVEMISTIITLLKNSDYYC